MNDDELRRRLHSADPASSLPPADPHRVARLLEDTRRDTTDAGPRPTGPPADRLRDRGPLPRLVAAAALLALVGGLGLALADRAGDPADAPVADGTGEPSTTARTTVLTAPSPRAARCLQPSATTLRGRELAVDATATEVTGERVTLVPRRFYAGEPTDRVVVEAAPAALNALVGAVEFETGERYLVSANDGQVSVCGFSAPWSPRLAELYAQAFGSPSGG